MSRDSGETIFAPRHQDVSQGPLGFESILGHFGVGLPESLSSHFCQGPLKGGGFKRGVSRSGLVLPCLSFFVLFGTFPIFLGFSRFARGWSGDFPICPFPLSRPIKSTYEEQSRKGPRHKSGKHPGLETPRFSFSQFWVPLIPENSREPPAQTEESKGESDHFLEILEN